MKTPIRRVSHLHRASARFTLTLVLGAATAGWTPCSLAQDLAQGLLLHWPMDQSTGLSASDASGQGRAGTLINYLDETSHWVGGKSGNALNFSAAGSNYVAVAGLPQTTSTTWSAWVYLATPSNFAAVVSATYAGAPTNVAGHSLGFDTGANVLYPRVLWNHTNAATALRSPEPISTNQWHHLAVTYDAPTTTLKLYVDGELKGMSNNAAMQPLASINLGRRESSANSYYEGGIDEVRVYQRALSEVEIQMLAGWVVTGPPLIVQHPAALTVYEGQTAAFTVKNQGLSPYRYQWYHQTAPIDGATNATLTLTNVLPSNAGNYRVTITNTVGSTPSQSALLTVIAVTNFNVGLQGHWKFDEKTGTTAADASGQGNHGTLWNFAGDDSQWVTGKVEGAIAFNNTLMHYVEVPDHPSIGARLTRAFSVATWFKSNVALSTNGGTYRMLEKGDSYFLLQGDGNTNGLGRGGMNVLVKRNNGNLSAALYRPIEANRWYHLTATFDGNLLRLYLDGELTDTRTVGGPIDDDRLPLRIGSDDSGRYFNGAMDDVRIWDRALSAREVLNVMGRDLPEAPKVVTQPQSATRYAGASVSLSVTVSGQEPLTLGWHQDGQAIPNATNTTLSLVRLRPVDAGSYRVRITNSLGTAESDAALLTVLPIVDVTTGRAAFWRFDETNGLTAMDSTTNLNHGALTDYADPATAWVPGRVGGALQFDGVSQRVVVPHHGSLNLGSDPSMACWVKPASYGTLYTAGTYDIREGHILRKGTEYDLYTIDNPGGVRQTVVTTGASAPQTCLSLDEWQHFAVVYQAGTIQFYRNGFPLGVPATGGPGAPATTNLVLGNTSETLDAVRLYQGLLDEVSLWARPLLEGEVLALAGKDAVGQPAIEQPPQAATRLEGGAVEFVVLATGKRPVTYQWLHENTPIPGAVAHRLVLTNLTVADSGAYTVTVRNDLGETTSPPAQLTVQVIQDTTTGLVGYWKFDETSGTTFADASGRGHPAALQNGTAIPGVAGLVGGAYDFDGVDDFAVVADHADFDLVDQITLAAWVSPRVPLSVGPNRIARKDINWDLGLAGGLMRFYGINKTAYDSPANSVTTNEWQHLAVVVKNGTIQFFRNGVALAAPMPAQLGPANTNAVIIGNFQSDLAITRLLNGVMDELGLWSRGLSAREIEGIYLNGLAGKPLTSKIESLQIQSLAELPADQLRLVVYSPASQRTHRIHQTDAVAPLAWSETAGVQWVDRGQGLLEATWPRGTNAAAFYRVALIP